MRGGRQAGESGRSSSRHPRRDGDIAECYADPALAKRLLGWQAELSIERACADGWRWQQRNPDGCRA
jgi:UDP-glucose 4-epimerase